MIKNILIVVVALGLVSSGIYLAYSSSISSKHSVPVAVDYSSFISKKASVLPPAAKKSAPNKIVPKKIVPKKVVVPEPVLALPEELNLSMPFYTQAPYANWDYPWQEACEEASILLVANVYQDKKWTRAQFNDEILKMVDWQNKRFGDYWHTTMEQTKEILEEYLGLKAVIHEDPSLEDMKRILAKGHFIILPLDGKTLKNPYFLNGGPVYHVVPMKGYTKDNGIITHDVGTRRGEDYVYTWEVIDSSFHDYAIPMSEGARRIIEVLPSR